MKLNIAHKFIHAICKFSRDTTNDPLRSKVVYYCETIYDTYYPSINGCRSCRKRYKRKLAKYDHGGKYSECDVITKLIHLIEELNEYVFTNKSKYEMVDVLVQSKVIINHFVNSAKNP